MSSVVDRMKVAGYLTESEAERVRKSVDEMVKAARKDPSLVDETKRKMANIFGVDVPETLKILGASALATMGTTLAGDLYRHTKDSLAKSRSYKAMMDDNPELAKLDAKQVQRAFTTLYNANPHYASDSLVAGDFVASTVNQQGIDYTRLKGIVDARRSGPSGAPSAFDYLTHPSTAVSMLRYDHQSEERKMKAQELQQKQQHQQQWHDTRLKEEQLKAEAERKYMERRDQRAQAHHEAQVRAYEDRARAEQARRDMYLGAQPYFQASKP